MKTDPAWTPAGPGFFLFDEFVSKTFWPPMKGDNAVVCSPMLGICEADWLMKNKPKLHKRQRVPIQAKHARAFAARDRSVRAIWDMRHGVSLSQAARNNGVSKETIKKYVGSALLQDRPGGRIRATKSDRYVRYLQIPGLHGPVEITAHGSKEANRAAAYKAAVNRFLAGDLNALASWHGKKIAGIELITDGPTLKGLAQNDQLPYSLYRSLSGGAS